MDDAEITLRAFAHPMRLRLLSLLTGSAMSAAEVAREVGGTQANASYHLRQLAAAGLVEVAEEVSVRGGRAKRYRHHPHAGQRMTQPGADERMAIVATLAEELRRRTQLRAQGPGPMADAELWVDPAVWEQVVNRVIAVMTDLHEAAKAPRTPGTIRTSSTLSMFVMRSDDAERP